jgi:hypothetical protein
MTRPTGSARPCHCGRSKTLRPPKSGAMVLMLRSPHTSCRVRAPNAARHFLCLTPPSLCLRLPLRPAAARPARGRGGGGVGAALYLGSARPTKRNRAALSRPAGWGKSLRQSITSSHSAHASIVALDRDGPTATEPSSLVGVTAVAAVASVVPLTVCRSPSIDPNATRSYVHTLSQTRRWRSNGHCANESQCNQCSRDQHGLSPFPVSVSSG